MCRLAITYDLEGLRSIPKPRDDKIEYEPSSEVQELQQEMAALFRKQQERGGIIDVEAENAKYLVSLASGSSVSIELNSSYTGSTQWSLHFETTPSARKICS